MFVNNRFGMGVMPAALFFMFFSARNRLATWYRCAYPSSGKVFTLIMYFPFLLLLPVFRQLRRYDVAVIPPCALVI